MTSSCFYLCRIYSGLAHQELKTLKSCVLVDEFERSLKNKDDYRAARDHIFQTCPDLIKYLKSYVIPAPGDWPTWYYQKKIIAQEDSSNSPYLSLIPEQGPLLVSLNAQEDVIQIYHFFFYQLYKDIFATELPKKPKPFRVQLLLMSVLFGWLMIRDKVIRKFDLCKDIEYACILHILDEVVPLAFFHYASVFEGRNLQMYSETMFRFLVLFIVWDRKHYDKSTLSFLSDLIHQKLNFKKYYEMKERFLTLITEVKVEIWHSLLRSRVQPHHKAHEIHEKAHFLMGSESGRNFEESLTRPYSRGASDKDLTLIAGKAAECLLVIFLQIAKNIGKSKEVRYIQLFYHSLICRCGPNKVKF